MPDTMVDAEVLKDAVQLACRAPSLHNSQPWQWTADSAGLYLYVDRARMLYSADKSGREALIGCGGRARSSARRDGGRRVDCPRRAIP